MRFYDLALKLVKKAFTKYLLHKDSALLQNSLMDSDSGLILFDSMLLGDCEILEEEYNYKPQGNNLCIVNGVVTINNEKGDLFTERRTNITALCINDGESVKFIQVHTSASKLSVLNENNRVRREIQYRNVMEHMCDFLLEWDIENKIFYCNEDKYRAFFEEELCVNSADELFWHLCNDFAYKQDSEKLDIFRPNDIMKRFKNEEFIFDTQFRMRTTSRDCVWVHMRVVFIPSYTEGGISKIYFIMEDISEEMTEKLRNLEFARTDDLTQLWNRRYTKELVEAVIRDKGRGIFALVDVDHFKNVNDTYGHITGDNLLIEISENMAGMLAPNDIIGRIGGDEFVVFVSLGEDAEADKERMNKVIEAARFTYHEADLNMDIHCSAGAVVFENFKTTFDELYNRADKAMYQAKQSGRDRTNIVVI